ncbi:MAG TPA: hypothetical protein VFX23_07935 [Limnobacter sp.]|uniref:hypothetical protein n=1 Tax=Limnobacter sp. TaxID=2003368 RepID=UPI002E34D0C1|nr:hypothetical protein [Limnobacter sp.]HEX5485912.1 hypothetical protein [Limnobacter sp.]
MPNSFHHHSHLKRDNPIAKGLTAIKIRDLHIRPALNALSLFDVNDERLLLGTAAIESRFLYLKQFGGGPVRGYWQMEPETHDSLWTYFLSQSRNRQLAEAIKSLLEVAEKVSIDSCLTNHTYAAAMARVKYLSCPGGIPTSLSGQAHYWKRWYNCSPHGRSEQDYIEVWNTFCSPMYSKFR